MKKLDLYCSLAIFFLGVVPTLVLAQGTVPVEPPRVSILQAQGANKQDIAKLEYKVAELERIVSGGRNPKTGKLRKEGLQKQVTILRAKVDALEAKAK